MVSGHAAPRPPGAAGVADKSLKSGTVPAHKGEVRELLTPALAGTNPKAYFAHFKRLDAEGQRAYLGRLSADDLRLHFRALGETATVGLLLTVAGPALEATVGGGPLGRAEGADCAALQARALALGREIDAKVVSGMVSGGSLARLPELESALATVGWSPRTVVLAGDSGGGECAPSLGWSLRGAVADVGTFYMPGEPLLWGERGEVEALLRDFAARAGAVFDARLH